MPLTRLPSRSVDKPWGRRDIGPPLDEMAPGGAPLGEIWFEAPGGDEPELLVKYLFTGERLSIQVHPDDDAARAAGQRRGKSEAWVILEADPGACIGLGTREVMTADELARAARDGSIEARLFWRPVRAGEVLSSPAGTIHALGPGLKLIELQQNADTTYRLYDWGRPRELHVEDAVRVASPVPWIAPPRPAPIAPGRDRLVAGPAFSAERWTGARKAVLAASPARPVWLIPVSGVAHADGEGLDPGTVWLADTDTELRLGGSADLILAAPGDAPIPLS